MVSGALVRVCVYRAFDPLLHWTFWVTEETESRHPVKLTKGPPQAQHLDQDDTQTAADILSTSSERSHNGVFARYNLPRRYPYDHPSIFDNDKIQIVAIPNLTR